MAEDVFIVPRVELFDDERDAFEGFRAHAVGQEPGDKFATRIAGSSKFLPRDDVEEDPTLKQIIPYGLVTHTRPDDSVDVFLMRRTKGGGEARLHDRFSLGVGGHINPVDGPNDSLEDQPEGQPGEEVGGSQEGTGGFVPLVDAALHREIAEELHIETDYSARVIGFINDDSDAVGQVHFGVVYRVEVAEPRVRVREVDRLEGRFVAHGELAEFVDRMETWSQLVIGSPANGLPELGALG